MERSISKFCSRLAVSCMGALYLLNLKAEAQTHETPEEVKVSGEGTPVNPKPSLEHIPTQVLMNILSNLNVKDIIGIRQTAKRFKDITDNPEFWKNEILVAVQKPEGIFCYLLNEKANEKTKEVSLDVLSHLAFPVNKLIVMYKSEGVGLNKEILNHLLQVTNLKYLTDLDLSNGAFGEEGIKALVPIAGDLKHLVKLNLRGSAIRDTAAPALKEILSNLENLASLDLSDNHLGELGFQALAETLGNLKNLTYLNLNYNRYFGSDGMKRVNEILIPTLKNLPKLKHLCLVVKQGNKWHNWQNLQKQFPEIKFEF